MSNTQNAPKHSNRLTSESSPYLLQHAHNPMDWYPWSDEAIEFARQQDKPIFLSIGYSTCYWCHVMERQSFENEEIAAEMNRLFVNIKVDREQRPDLDQLYMMAVQVMTQQGGWPMSVWLTPELKPFYAGTYFPPTDQHGRPGLITISRAVVNAYTNRRQEINRAADELTRILQQLARPRPSEHDTTLDKAWMDHMIERSMNDYDPEHGGFGSAPKFPRQTLLGMLLMHQRISPDARQMKLIRHALDAMAAGGIHDHLGGGFHRYSTDAQWLIPHFEIMLYDNALLAWIYAEAFDQTHEAHYADVCRGILDFLLRQMRSPEGAFYTALDAEVDAMEGANYLWTLDEVRDLLGEKDAEIFARRYGLNAGPNFTDPHQGGGQPEKNVLYEAESTESIARSISASPAVLEERLGKMRQELYQARQKRKQPRLDNKILASWNALTISGLAHAGKILNDDRYTQAAITAAEYILKNNSMLRFLDDYAFFSDSLLELFHATGQARWKTGAEKIMGHLQDHFGDKSSGFYFTDRQASDLIVRQKIGADSPLPSGNATAARALIELGQFDSARNIFTEFAGQLQDNGESMSAMIGSLDSYLRTQSAIPVRANHGAGMPTPDQIAENIVTANGRWLDDKSLRVVAEIQPDFHINAREPSAGLIATELIVTGANVQRIEYPPAQSMKLGDQTIAGYSGRISLDVVCQPPIQREKIKLEMRYQACDQSRCLAPARIGVTII